MALVEALRTADETGRGLGSRALLRIGPGVGRSGEPARRRPKAAPSGSLGVGPGAGTVVRLSSSRISAEQLAALMERTGDAPRAAYPATVGTDPGWANWYSGHLQTLLGDGLGRPITRSEIVYLLCQAQRKQDADGSDEPWTAYYANLILSETA